MYNSAQSNAKTDSAPPQNLLKKHTTTKTMALLFRAPFFSTFVYGSCTQARKDKHGAGLECEILHALMRMLTAQQPCALARARCHLRTMVDKVARGNTAMPRGIKRVRILHLLNGVAQDGAAGQNTATVRKVQTCPR